MVEVGKCRLEPNKDKRVAQILATDVTREQLAEVVWSMERTHATQHDLIMELMDSCNRIKDRNYELRTLVRDVWDAALHPETFGDGSHLLKCMRDLGIEAE